MLFVLHRLDRAGASHLRDLYRRDHLEFLAQHSGHILLAGAYRDPATEQEVGSLYLLRFNNLTEANAFANGDPFMRADLFSDVQVRPWKNRVGALSNLLEAL